MTEIELDQVFIVIKLIIKFQRNRYKTKQVIARTSKSLQTDVRTYGHTDVRTDAGYTIIRPVIRRAYKNAQNHNGIF